MNAAALSTLFKFWPLTVSRHYLWSRRTLALGWHGSWRWWWEISTWIVDGTLHAFQPLTFFRPISRYRRTLIPGW